MTTIRTASMEDLEFLDILEKSCFSESRRSSKKSLRLSLVSPFQKVYIAEYESEKAGSVILLNYKKVIRIYSIAILPKFQKKSIGKDLVEYVKNIALLNNYPLISIEADSNNRELIEWYKKLGFIEEKTIENYYGDNEPALKMTMQINNTKEIPKTLISGKNYIVCDTKIEWLEDLDSIEMITAKNYITDTKYHKTNGARVFNLCNSYKYQSTGYYVSLLASARDHRVIPNVTTIKDFADNMVMKSIGQEISKIIESSLAHINKTDFNITVLFGQCENKEYNKLAKEIYNLFEAPYFEMYFIKKDTWILQKIIPLSIKKIPKDKISIAKEFAYKYFNQKRFNKSHFKNYKYDLAILINPHEEHAPSCETALEIFKKSAEKIGFYTEFITKKDYKRLGEFDALFIRETTDVNNHTYQFSRFAYAEGLVVIDDPWSILRCSNKLFLSERMKKVKVQMPKSWVLTKHNGFHEDLTFPLVLKRPDSAFSLGVFKVNTEEELNLKLKELFKYSELIVAQEFLESDFDWRIGIIDNSPLFACRYYMAENHWQIYDWTKTNDLDIVGKSVTFPINQVPTNVLEVALKASAQMGDGLYGVDLKVVNNKVYLIEVNDNPNIDFDVEDKILGTELYDRIVQSIFNRIENARSVKRFISN